MRAGGQLGSKLKQKVKDNQKISFNDLYNYSDWPKILSEEKEFKTKTKNKINILREFNDDKWGRLVSYFHDKDEITIDELEAKYDNLDQIEPYYENNNFYITLNRNILSKHLNYYSKFIQKYNYNNPSIVELGAGYGSKILGISKFDNFSKNSLIAAEYTENGRTLLHKASNSCNNKVIVGGCDFNKCKVDKDLIPEDSIIFTSYALMCIPFIEDKLIDFFIELKPKVIINFEPCYELYDSITPHDIMCKKYIEINGYSKNIYSAIKKKSMKGDCQLLGVSHKVVSFNPFVPISAIEWKPN